MDSQTVYHANVYEKEMMCYAYFERGVFTITQNIEMPTIQVRWLSGVQETVKLYQLMSD